MINRTSNQDLFKIHGGDGVQGYFDTIKALKIIEEPWFNGFIGNEESMLFELVNHNESDKFKYLAVTSRLTASTASQLMHQNGASVIVYGVEYNRLKFPNLRYGVHPLGMSYIEKYNHNTSEQ